MRMLKHKFSVKRNLQITSLLLLFCMFQAVKSNGDSLECYKCSGGVNGECANGPFKDSMTTTCGRSNTGSTVCVKQKTGHMILRGCKFHVKETEFGCIEQNGDLSCVCREHLCNGVNSRFNKKKLVWNMAVTLSIVIIVI